MPRLMAFTTSSAILRAPQLEHEFLAVGFDRVFRQEEQPGDLPCVVPLGDGPEHVQLALREGRAVGQLRSRAARALADAAEAAAEVGFAPEYRFDRPPQLLGVGGFEDDGVHAAVHQPVDVPYLLVHGIDDDACLRIAGAEVSDQVETREVGQFDVEDAQIERRPADQLQRLLSRTCGPNGADRRNLFEDVLYAVQDKFVIVNK